MNGNAHHYVYTHFALFGYDFGIVVFTSLCASVVRLGIAFCSVYYLEYFLDFVALI